MLATGRAVLTDYRANLISLADGAAKSIGIVTYSGTDAGDDFTRIHVLTELGGTFATDGILIFRALYRFSVNTGWTSSRSTSQIADVDLKGTPVDVFAKALDATLLKTVSAALANAQIKVELNVPTPPGVTEICIVCENQSGGALSATAGDHVVELDKLRVVSETS